MQNRDVKDIVSGAVLVLVGTGLAFYITSTLRMGRATDLGPGAMPLIMAVALAALGVVTLLSGLRSGGRDDDESFDLAGLLSVTLGVVGFGFIVLWFGLVPAVVFQLLVSSAFDRRFTLKQRLVFTALMTAVAYLIFNTGLGVQIPAVKWPW